MRARGTRAATFGRQVLAAVAVAAMAAMPRVAPAMSLEDLRDPEDGRFDTSRFLLDLKGFLPMPILITEPAIGYGGGAALLFFSRNPPPEGGAASGRQFNPPDITAVGGIATENGTRGGFAGHLGFSADGKWRYVGGVGRMSLNVAYYGDPLFPGSVASDGIDYTLKADVGIVDVRRRVGDTPWYAGLRYVYSGTESKFDTGRPAEIPARQLDMAIGGLALLAEYDDRDSIFTPGSGTRFTAYVHDFGERFGGDQSFRLYKAAVNHYASVHRNVVLGARLDYRASSGDTPFYALPFVELRGIPALRYQGERAAVAELEGRWNLDGRWSLIGFAGAGKASGRSGDLGSADTRWAGGIGFRYYLARALGLHAGVDVARGPEESAIYLILGSAWR
jgi:hypothetical protein